MSPESGSSTLDFLRSIWPEGYTYCIAVKPPGKGVMRQSFFTSIADASAFAELAAARGLETYHGCAAFKDDSSRKQTNVAAVKALWLDIDVGPKKPYQDERSALAALFSFCHVAELPIPTIIHSGGGWHAYWVLEEVLPLAVWQHFATALRDACTRYGLHADPAITIDGARILRPPGTFNFKRETPALVEVRRTAPPVSARVFTKLKPIAAAPPVAPMPAYLQNATFADNAQFAAKPQHNEGAAYASIIVQSCRQLACLRDAQGRVDEPFWYAALCLMAACEDGERLAHEWSKGDERYTHAGTSKKLEQARGNSGPTTCGKFQSLNPEGCIGCPHFGRITSPIQLGREAAPPGEPQAAAPDPFVVVGNIQMPRAPFPFKRSKTGGLEILETDEDTGATVTRTVYKAPLFLESIREHELVGGMALILKHMLPHEGWLDCVIPWHDRSQKAVINYMAAQKINVPRARERDMLQFLEASIDEFQSSRKTDMEYAQFGWRNDFQEFVLGDESYRVGHKAPFKIGVTPELVARSKQMKPYGSFEAWRGAAQPLFVHEQQGLMVVAGFASVLMRFVQELTGVIIAAVSPEPRLGKTMGLIAARSIWGDDNAIDIATNDTANSRFRMLAVLNGLPATWDDMRKSNDPEIIKQFVLSFSQGRDKNRLEKSGALRSNTSGWASVLLATSNISIAELVGHDGETAQQARILEYRFQPMEGMKFADGQQYERIMRANRGQAGRKFIQALMLPGMVDWLKLSVPQYVREFEVQLARADASFYASFLGCVKAASEVLNKTGMLEFSVDRLIKFAIDSAAKMGRVMEENKVQPVDVFVRFVNDNWQNALVVQDKWTPKQEASVRKAPTGKLYIRYEVNTQRIYVDRHVMREWCRVKNIMFRDIAERLMQQGVMLNENRKMNLGAGTPFSGAGQANCFEIDQGHYLLGNIQVVEEHAESRVPPKPVIVKRVLTPGKILEAQKPS